MPIQLLQVTDDPILTCDIIMQFIQWLGALQSQHDHQAASFHLSCECDDHHFHDVVCCDCSCILCSLICCHCHLGFSSQTRIRCLRLLGHESWDYYYSQTPCGYDPLQLLFCWDESCAPVACWVLSCGGGGCRAVQESKQWLI